MFNWFGYLKRLSLIILMLSGIILYYIPESRPHARRICYMLIDFTANGLKSALSARESEYLYEKIKSKYDRIRYEHSLASQKCIAPEIQDENEHIHRPHKSISKKSKVYLADDMMGNKERVRKKHKDRITLSKSRHLRSSMKDISMGDCAEISKPIYFYPEKLDDFQKYVKTSLSGLKRDKNLENYTLLISGNPQQMALFDQKFDKEDMVIVQDPYMKVEYKECGTSTDKLSAKVEASSSEQEGPTRDLNENDMETYIKEIEFNSIPENTGSRYSMNKLLYQTSQCQCEQDCCRPNEYSFGSLNNKTAMSTQYLSEHHLRSSRSSMNPKLRKVSQENENLFTSIDCNNHMDNCPMKHVNSNTRRVDFREDEVHNEPSIEQKQAENRYFENIIKSRKKKPRNNESPSGFCCNDFSYLTDRGGEADDENSQHMERPIRKHYLDEKPQKENTLLESSDESILDYCEGLDMEPILKNRLKPALLRAVNWIFGGCPEASRKAALKRNKIEKEGNQETDEWFL